jgi:hypothetical protein
LGGARILVLSENAPLGPSYRNCPGKREKIGPVGHDQGALTRTGEGNRIISESRVTID